MNKRILNKAILLLCALMAALLSGCHIGNISLGIGDYITGEEYPNAENYQTGTFTYNADEIKAVEVYWRSGEVEITEPDASEFHVRESGGELSEDIAMHYLIDDGVLRIRFCASGAKIQVNATDKHLSLEVPKGIELSVHTTSALVKADTLEQNDILIAAHSGSTKLGTVTAESVDLSSSSGSIQAESVSAQALKCSASSGPVDLGIVSAKKLECSTSSGFVTMGDVNSETVEITTSSGSVELALTEVLTAVIHTSSGKVNLALAKGGAEVLYTSNSGKLLTGRTYERKGDLYVFGSGDSKLTVETSSGNLEIK